MKNLILTLAISISLFSLGKEDGGLIVQQNFKPVTFELSEQWIANHFEAKIKNDLFIVSAEGFGYEDANVSLVYKLTGYEYKFDKDFLTSTLNLKDLPRGAYSLKISDDFLYTHNSDFELK